MVLDRHAQHFDSPLDELVVRSVPSALKSNVSSKPKANLTKQYFVQLTLALLIAQLHNLDV